MKTETVLQRKNASKESIWSGEKVFPSWKAWEKERAAVAARLAELTAFDGQLVESPLRLADWFELYGEIRRKVVRLRLFAGFSTNVDSNDTEAKGALGLAMSLMSEFSAATAFAEPAMMANAETLITWVKEEPRLKVYTHYIENLIRQKAHLRSAEIEELLSMLEDPFEAVGRSYTELTNTDLKFEDAVDEAGTRHPVQQATIYNAVQSPDREQRRTAWENYFDAYCAMENTLASNYIAQVKQQIFLAKVRGYESVLAMRLSPYNVPEAMFHNLIEEFTTSLPTWHRYWDVKRKALGLDEIHPYDVWAPIQENPPKVPYTKAVDWICEALEPVGRDYVGVMRGGCLEEGWVDWAPNAGKRLGAASMAQYDMPPFIFMSYNDSVFSMSTLAHELGHSLHSYYTDSNQPEIYNGYGLSMTVAETASNFNQAMTRVSLQEKMADDFGFQIALIEEAMANFHRYFFVMPTLARFELEVYTRAEQGNTLTTGSLKEIMKEKYAEGYGEMMTDDPDRTSMTWATFGHLYVPFYTFQYAIGISAAHAIQNRITAGVDGAVSDYLEFLRAGSSLYPMDVFKLAGVDMSKGEPVETAFAILEKTVERLAALAGQENQTP